MRMGIEEFVENFLAEIGHPDFIQIGKSQGNFYGNTVGGFFHRIPFPPQIPAWLLHVLKDIFQVTPNNLFHFGIHTSIILSGYLAKGKKLKV
jgi:hypothetical protein